MKIDVDIRAIKRPYSQTQNQCLHSTNKTQYNTIEHNITQYNTI